MFKCKKCPVLHITAAWTRVWAALAYHKLLFHIYPLIMTGRLLNRKNEVSWIHSDKLVGCCHLHWFPSHTIPVPRDSRYMHHQILLLPGVTALQQGSDGLPEFTYKPPQRENGAPTLSVGQQQHGCLQDQHLELLAQSVQAGSVHQRGLCAEVGERSAVRRLLTGDLQHKYETLMSDGKTLDTKSCAGYSTTVYSCLSTRGRTSAVARRHMERL